jgi:hypothetical protein
LPTIANFDARNFNDLACWLHELTYQPMREVLSYLRANGFKTYIVTGGGQDFVRVYSERVYGIPPEQVVGTIAGTSYSYDKDGKPILTKEPKLLLNDNDAGKPQGIHLMIGRRPLAAFGNSPGNQQMLEYTAAGTGARLKMLVLHDDAKREYDYGPAEGCSERWLKPWLNRRVAAEHESHQHVDAEAIDLAVRHDDFLLLDPRALDVLERLVGPGDSFLDRVLKALHGSRRDFNDLGDRHDQTSCAKDQTAQGSIAQLRRFPETRHQRTECLRPRTSSGVFVLMGWAFLTALLNHPCLLSKRNKLARLAGQFGASGTCKSAHSFSLTPVEGLLSPRLARPGA